MAGVPIRGYSDKGTRDVAAGVNSKAARATLPGTLHDAARRRLAFLAAVQSLDDLRAWTGLDLHALTGDRRGQHSIRINSQYRICFVWAAPDADDVEIVDYH
jgi:proteic killer suppression protein